VCFIKFLVSVPLNYNIGHAYSGYFVMPCPGNDICLCGMVTHHDNPKTFNLQPFKSHIFAAARALFNLNSHCGTAFFFSGQKDVHLLRESFTVFLSKG